MSAKEIHFPGPTLYGILDTSEPGRQIWIGTQHGPLTYQDIALANVAATVMNARCGRTDRFTARIIRDEDYQLRDTITPLKSARDAIVELEGYDDGSWDTAPEMSESEAQALSEQHGVRVLPMRRRGAA